MSEDCDENSECVKGQCVCKDNTENGASKGEQELPSNITLS